MVDCPACNRPMDERPDRRCYHIDHLIAHLQDAGRLSSRIRECADYESLRDLLAEHFAERGE